MHIYPLQFYFASPNTYNVVRKVTPMHRRRRDRIPVESAKDTSERLRLKAIGRRVAVEKSRPIVRRKFSPSPPVNTRLAWKLRGKKNCETPYSENFHLYAGIPTTWCTRARPNEIDSRRNIHKIRRSATRLLRCPRFLRYIVSLRRRIRRIPATTLPINKISRRSFCSSRALYIHSRL